MQIIPLSDHVGADILGVDLAHLEPSDFENIYQAWLDHVVLRFRGQNLSDDDLQGFSERFGPLEEMPLGRMPEEMRRKIKNKFVTVISNITVDGKPIGGLGNAEANWHSDMSYVDNPPTASVLLGVEIPPAGGATHFASQYAAYDALPPALKARVEGLTIKHDAAHTSVSELRHGFEQPTSPIDAPGAVHPIVKVHAETGRKALFLGRREWAYVVGLSLEESEQLLDELWDHAAQPRFAWRQDWQVGDVVIWDNRCSIHRRDEFDPSLRRLLRRCQVLAKDPA